MFDAYQMVSKLNPLINQPINYVLNLNTRAKNCLLAEEIVTVADLFKRLEREKYFLEKVPNMGKATAKLILDELARVFPLMKLQNGENDERTAKSTGRRQASSDLLRSDRTARVSVWRV
jgi:DNA-directed RNA polymerase alpha subunit